jgi:hypothetical protein
LILKGQKGPRDYNTIGSTKRTVLIAQDNVQKMGFYRYKKIDEITQDQKDIQVHRPRGQKTLDRINRTEG